jgi:hypothetical protein
MRRLSTDEVKTAKGAFSCIFHLPDSEEFLNRPFNPQVERKIIICDYQSGVLRKSQFDALHRAAKKVNETFCYIVEVDYPGYPLPFEEREEHWLLPLSDNEYKTYSNPPHGEGYYGMMCNTLYSPKGTWGILLTHEEWGFLGGTNEFIKIFISEYRDNAIDVNEFQKVWDHYKPTAKSNWASDILEYIYGDH